MSENAKKLLSSSVIVFIGTIIGSVFSYLFNMLMGRMLGPEQYGEMTALMSLITIVLVGSGAVLTVVMKFSSDLYHQKEISALKKLFNKFTLYAIILGAVLFVVGLSLIHYISTFFSINNTLAILITLSSMLFGYLVVVSRGILQGTQKFGALSFTNALEMFLKLTVGVLLVKLGFGLNGALGGIVISTVVIYFVILVPAKKIFKEDSGVKKDQSEFKFNKKEILAYSLPAFISTLLLVVAMNIDVVMVKHFFSAEDAGLYSAVSTVGKIILFITAPIISVMFPMISEHKIKGSKHYKVLLMALLLTLFGGLLILGVYAVMPSVILRILYGPTYTQMYYLLPEVGIAILFYSLINLLVNYFLAIKDYVFLYLFGFVMIIMTLWISLSHPSIQYVVRIIISSFGLLFFLMMTYYLYVKKSQLISFFRGEYGEETQTIDNNSGL